MVRNSSDKLIAYLCLYLALAYVGKLEFDSIHLKLIVITFSMFVQFERVRAVLKGVAPDEGRLYKPMPDQIPRAYQNSPMGFVNLLVKNLKIVYYQLYVG